LNHKTAIESQHDGLLNHKNEIENLLQMHAHLSNRLDLQTNSLSTHQVLQSANETKYNTLHKTLKDMQHSSNLELEKIEKVTAQLSTHEKGILHHTDILRDHKSKIDKTSMAISDYQRKTDNHDTDITSLQASLQNIERKLTKHDSTAQKLENLTESVDMIRRKLTNDTQQKLQDLHERCTAVESSQHLHSKKINSMMATNETQVQFQVLGPRRR
jgi:chromosome segregation ATPase